MRETVNILFEAAMLKKTPRSGLQFLGSGAENVAEHIFMTIFIGYSLCKMMPTANEQKVLKLCLLHDLPEARTGDLNYVNKKYVQVDEGKAVADLAAGLFFGEEIRTIIKEFNENNTLESQLARDADQLSLILMLKHLGDLGNSYSKDWIHYACRRLLTPVAVRLAEEILATDSSDWWFQDRSDWWVNGNQGNQENQAASKTEAGEIREAADGDQEKTS
jgi:putative hydrolase of HD superfamily